MGSPAAAPADALGHQRRTSDRLGRLGSDHEAGAPVLFHALELHAIDVQREPVEIRAAVIERRREMTLFVENRALLLAFRAGDADALAQVYWHYVDQVARWIRRFGPRDLDGVADLVQEAFIRAFAPQARASYDGVRPYRAYLRRIVRNLIVDRARASGRATEELEDDALEADDSEPTPDDAMMHHRIAIATREFIAGLDEESRIFVQLRFQDEES